MSLGISLPSFAKVNLLLRVLGKRDDGFHELFTVFQSVSLHDTLHFEECSEIELTCDNPSVPTDEQNLVFKAATTLKRQFSVRKGAKIHLEKLIPSPGGLGGGSSNAAVALIGLRKLWNLELGGYDLASIAAELGSDVPYFLHGGTAIGTGRGEKIEEIDDLDARHMLIVTPNLPVSTGFAYSALNRGNLTNSETETILTVCRNEAKSLDLRHSALTNDFEQSVFADFPEVKRVKGTLLELGAAKAALSGSGASVFAIFDKQETRQAAQDALEENRDWRKFAVSTVSRENYAKALFV
ncbi:MAG: 4-(cytidine 5'-diphospho)-2-C-methyl-D-erythritol kinase [Pyrinomonadaceae bacterium]